MSAFIKFAGDQIRQRDKIVRKSHALLHYQKNHHAKTILGGLISLFVTGLVCWRGIDAGIAMFSNKHKSFISQEYA